MAALGSVLESAENERLNLANTSTNPRVGEEGKASHFGSIGVPGFPDIFFTCLVADLRIQGKTKRLLRKILGSSSLSAIH